MMLFGIFPLGYFSLYLLIMFLVAFLGYCGALREFPFMLYTYAVVFGVIAIIEVSVAIYLLVYGFEVRTYPTSHLCKCCCDAFHFLAFLCMPTSLCEINVHY